GDARPRGATPLGRQPGRRTGSHQAGLPGRRRAFPPSPQNRGDVMKARFLLLPVAAITVASPVHATVYLSVEQAQEVLFPSASFTPDARTLTGAQASAIEKASGVSVRNRKLNLWRVSTGGWFIADEVVG